MTAAPLDDAPDSAAPPEDGRRDAGTLVFDADAPPAPRTGPRQAEAVAAIQPGALLGRFEIVRRLGGGGMGEVFLARDPDLDRDVAIKVLSGPAAADPDARRRFLLEGRAVARLSHPNVISIHEVGPAHLADSLETRFGDAEETAGDGGGASAGGTSVGGTTAAAEWDGPVYLVMDYAGDGSVDRLLRDGPLSVAQATAVAADAAAGLAAAHAAGLVHRDVKPANLMLEGGGPWNGGVVRVADFGLARRMNEDADGLDAPAAPADERSAAAGLPPADRRRVRRRVAGTPHFMSPEQCRGEAVDARSDLYSLGATYYALLAGRPPFAASPGGPSRPVTAVLNAHNKCDPPPVHLLERLGGAVPSACTRIILRAMAKDPADRYAGAAAFRKDALALLDALRRYGAAPPAPNASEASSEGGRTDPLPADFLLPSERAREGDDSNDSAFDARREAPSGGSSGGVSSGASTGLYDPAADTPAAGTEVEAADFQPLTARADGWGPPPGVRRETFSLNEGEVLLSYPASLKEAAFSLDEIDRLRAWLNLVRIKLMALAEEQPKS
ncbi:serine/threonine-protein kinase [Alienimonas californiensis]|uniref:Serine/threonine-protein kinase PknB n=1 Tax=Alienimonas californiensis TaxID=2527989 RepID=A0A517P931_9PLAN|nr:serine/threonine-protein kinase [Alienimonas californiensis]QDT15871.1 Serine/threonine-protein kinase PknB [Alienimonas californiensis]